MRNRFYLWIGE